jgi:hypothetical protein
VVEPLRPLFDDIVCARLGEVDGTFTGRLEELPPIGEARALVLADYAEAEGLQLEESMAYADSASDLPMLEAVGFPGGRQPRGQAGRHRPPAGVARRALAQGRRGLRAPPAARARSTAGARSGEGAPARPRCPGRPGGRTIEGGTVKALVFERNLPRFAASRVASASGSGRGAGIGPLQLLDAEPPGAPGEDWFHLRPLLSGICGSDLATLDGRSSRYFEDMVSFPFVPGHEVVGTLDDRRGRPRPASPLAPGTRAVIEPVLGCAPRHIRPPCPQCATGHTGLCGNVAFGHLEPGLQTGYCADTGGVVHGRPWRPRLPAPRGTRRTSPTRTR